MLENCDKIMHLHFNFDACSMHSPFRFVHLTHQNLSARALFYDNSLAKVNTQLLIYNYSSSTFWYGMISRYNFPLFFFLHPKFIGKIGMFLRQQASSTLSSLGTLKGCGMGPLLVLVSPCFRENVVVTCKIGSSLCSLNSFLQKNIIVFFFGNQILKWRSFGKKRAIFDLLFTFFSYQGKVTKIPSAHISHTYMYFAHPIDLFCLTNFEKKYKFIRYGFSLVWVLVLILIRAILEQSINNIMVSKI